MNTENILALASHLEVMDPRHFNMRSYRHDCGTPACVAGFAVALFDEDDSDTAVEKRPIDINIRVHEVAMGHLDLDDLQASRLFAPHTGPSWDPSAAWIQCEPGDAAYISPARAAGVLRNMVATGGEVDWSWDRPRPEPDASTTPETILKAALDLLRRGHSVEECYDADGDPVAPEHPNCVTWTISGAVLRAALDLNAYFAPGKVDGEPAYGRRIGMPTAGMLTLAQYAVAKAAFPDEVTLSDPTWRSLQSRLDWDYQANADVESLFDRARTIALA